MVRMKFYLGLALFIAGCSSSPDKDVSAINSELAAGDENFFLVGPARVGRANDLPNHIVSEAEYRQMKCLEAAGYIKFARDDEVRDGGPDAWEKLHDAIQLGISRNIETVLSDAGRKVNDSFEETESSKRYEASRAGLSLLKIRLTHTSLDDVVSDRIVEKDGGKFRVVEFTGTISPTEAGKPYLAACAGSKGESARLKAKALLKWDAFDKKWKFIVIDSAVDDRDIKTHNVEDRLKAS